MSEYLPPDEFDDSGLNNNEPTDIEVNDADLDELASAYIDGEISPDQRLLVESDPGLLKRVSELRAVQELVRLPLPKTSKTMQLTQISAALDTFDDLSLNAISFDDQELRATSQSQVLPSRVTAINDAPSAKQRRALPKWMSAAATSLVVLGGAGLFIALQGQNSDSDEISITSDQLDLSDSAENSALAETMEPGQDAGQLALPNDGSTVSGSASIFEKDTFEESDSHDEAGSDVLSEAGESSSDAAEPDFEEIPTAEPPVGYFAEGTPIEAILAELGFEVFGTDKSLCASTGQPTLTTPVQGFHNIIVGDTAAEVLISESGEAALVDSSTCGSLGQ